MLLVFHTGMVTKILCSGNCRHLACRVKRFKCYVQLVLRPLIYPRPSGLLVVVQCIDSPVHLLPKLSPVIQSNPTFSKWRKILKLRFSLVSIYQTDVTRFFRFSKMIFPLDLVRVRFRVRVRVRFIFKVFILY